MSGSHAFLAVDAGTTNIKTVAFSESGTELAKSTRSIAPLRPKPGHVEQRMETVRERATATIGDVLGSLSDDVAPAGVGITGQGDGLWPITAEGEPAGNAILWSDSRAAGVLDEWEAGGELDAIVEQCGSAPYPGMSLPLLTWLERERPADFDRIDTILSCKDWLAFVLTGERTIDHSEATVPYLDRSTGEYDPSVFETVGLAGTESVLPRLSAPTEIVGTVTPSAAEATDLPEGLPVVSGPFDVPASAFGGGAVTPGTGAVTLGTSLTHQVVVDGPKAEASGIQMALGTDGLWTYAIGSNAGTPSLEWAVETIADVGSISDLEGIASEAPIGSDGVVYHPYLSTSGERGPFVDPTARAQFLGLTPEHDTEHLVRAIYEGLTFAVRDCLSHLPADVTPVVASGGGTRSELWCQLLADVLDRPVVVPAGSEVGAKGAAMVLGVALDTFGSIEAAADGMVTHDREYRPREDAAAQYATLAGLFVDLREELPDVWAKRDRAYRETGASER